MVPSLEGENFSPERALYAGLTTSYHIMSKCQSAAVVTICSKSRRLSLRRRFKKLRDGTISLKGGMAVIQSRILLHCTVMHPRSWLNVLIESPSG